LHIDFNGIITKEKEVICSPHSKYLSRVEEREDM
jgi:hypothetical protein